MQSTRWYVRRLSSMSGPEIAWRVWSRLRGIGDRALRRRRARRIAAACPQDDLQAQSVCHQAIWGQAEPIDAEAVRRAGSDWLAELRAQADRLLEHRMDLFGLQGLQLGEDINWNYEYEAGRSCPMEPSARIDYRDYELVGDCKLVWELNRHHHLVVLARAYRMTGDERYASEVCRQLESWMEQCPYGLGMNWRSPLELAIRMINWAWTYELLGDCPAMTQELRGRVIRCVAAHLGQIDRDYSRFSSANNHLIGEAAGVFIAASYFSGLGRAAVWRDRARRILEREIQRQTHVDGGTCEQATGYHLFVLEFFTLAGLAARNSGADVSTDYWKRLEKMYEFIAAFRAGGDELPMIGDADDGYVLDLAGRCDRVGAWMSVGALLFGRGAWKELARGIAEPVLWLLGSGAKREFDRLPVPPGVDELRSQPLPGSGYYLLQSGRRGSSTVSAVFDSGELGFLSIAAHGHADVLSVLLRVGGVDVLVDPGTFDYFSHPEWRRYFRSTRAHNTIEVDGLDQSEMLGSFLWGRCASARLIRWRPEADGGTVVGEHDGYCALSDPVVHRRTVSLQGAVLTVQDELRAAAKHSIAQFWHFSEHCRVRRAGDGRYDIDFGTGKARMELDGRLEVELVVGREEPPLGWVSRSYHGKTATPTLIGHLVCDGPTTLSTRLEVVKGGSRRPQQAGGPGENGA